jgi:(1->4)-alpha-D-glucan 1-alpha-D-glucosylmutase
LIGIWPGECRKDLVERLKAYMLKSVREAKVNSSWINPDTEYESALERFVVQSLDNKLFIKDVAETVARVAHLGMLVGLSQALVKVASPGVPDYYQGSELWDFSLVDPDNRRPVDYALRRKLLDDTSEPLKNLADGRAKLHIIRKGLELRKKYPGLFHGGKYTALYADGGREENVIAFSLSDGTRAVIAVAPRLFARLMGEDDSAPLGEKAWGEASLALPEGNFTDALTGRAHSGGKTPVADLLSEFPVALLVSAA